jgi:hypothetical protein
MGGAGDHPVADPLDGAADSEELAQPDRVQGMETTSEVESSVLTPKVEVAPAQLVFSISLKGALGEANSIDI